MREWHFWLSVGVMCRCFQRWTGLEASSLLWCAPRGLPGVLFLAAMPHGL